MVAGHVSKDSWSRCEVSSMLYDTVRNPNAQYQPPKTSVKAVCHGKDTLESTQQRLKREMLDRFQNKGLELPHESYVAVTQVGKYVFLAVMLPVYLCCYGIPRWLLVTSLPFMLGILKNQTLHVGRFIFEMTKRVADVMKGLLEQLIGDALRLSRDRTRNLWKYGVSKFIRFSQAIAKMVKKISSRLEKSQQAFAKGSGKLYLKAEQNAEKTNQWIGKKTAALAKKMKVFFLRTWKAMDDVVFNPCMRLIAPLFKMLIKVYLSFKKGVTRVIKKINTQLSRAMNSIFSVFSRAIKKNLEALKQTLNRFLKPLGRWLKEKKESVNFYLRKVKKAIINPLSKAATATRKRLESYLLMLINFLKQVVFSFFKNFKLFFHFLWSKIPQKTKDRMKNQSQVLVRFGRLVKVFNQKVFLGFEALLFLVTTLGNKGKGGLILFMDSIKYVFQWIVKLLKALPQKIKHFFNLVFKVTAFIFARLVFTAHLFIALIWAASIYGFVLAKQFSDKKLIKI